jgi:hypothetical protein
MSICEMQHSVNVSDRTDATIRQELHHSLVNAARIAATGVSLPNPPPPGSPGNPDHQGKSLGRAYCVLIRAVFHTNVAQAQGTGSPKTGTGAPPPPVVRHQGAQGAQGAAPPTPRPPVPTTRVAIQQGVPAPDRVQPVTASGLLGIVSATIDADRARMEDNRRTNATYEVEIQKKFAISVACTIFVLLGAPIALRFPRGGVGLVIGVSFAVFGLYYVGLIAGEPLAQSGIISPFWAMWASNVIFTIAGFILLARVGRIGSTNRGGDLGEIKDAVRAWFSRLRPVPRTNNVQSEQVA